MVNEFTYSSWYKPDPAGINKGRHPWLGKTLPKPDRGYPATAYTYAKTPRYLNNESGSGFVRPEDVDHPNDRYLPYEVGPLARLMANCATIVGGLPLGSGNVPASVMNGDVMCYYPGVLNDAGYTITPTYGAPAAGLVPLLGTYLFEGGNLPGAIGGYKSNYVGDGTLDRIAARAMETIYIAKKMQTWFSALDPAKPVNVTRSFTWGGSAKPVMKKSKGAGLTEAPRGALGHWIKVGSNSGSEQYKGRTERYQIITPTAWNVSPLDPPNDISGGTQNRHGPIEESSMLTPVWDDAEPIEILRIIHSFDPCIACTVHTINAKGEKAGRMEISAMP
jgi:Ni,Fe-hydrogenase I large subunit